MNKHNIENMKESYFVFQTLSQRNIQELFQYHSRRYYSFDRTKLQRQGDYTYLPIDLKDWTNFEDALKVLYQLTNPSSGRPGFSMLSIIKGYDLIKQQYFVFKGEFIDGKHRVIGYYEDGQEMFFDKQQEVLYLNDNKDMSAYQKILGDWRLS
ncbi:MAG: hypothetical protein ACLUVC_14785 [Longibaculum sp.]